MIRPALILALVVLAACSGGKSYRERDVEMVTEESVDLERYMGRWYEIARFPNRFEKGCVGVTADYTLNEDGTVTVVNACREATLAGKVRRVEGVARVTDPSNAKLRVDFTSFLPSFLEGRYWILDVDPDYRVAVVGEPSGTTGWILAREPEISEPEVRRAYDVLDKNGYKLDQIYLTDQPGVGS